MKQTILLLIALINFSCNAQESIIVEKQKINWDEYEGLYENFDEKKFSSKFHFLENVDMYEITYLSDGLKIQSFAAFPKTDGKPSPSASELEEAYSLIFHFLDNLKTKE